MNELDSISNGLPPLNIVTSALYRTDHDALGKVFLEERIYQKDGGNHHYGNRHSYGSRRLHLGH